MDAQGEVKAIIMSGDGVGDLDDLLDDALEDFQTLKVASAEQAPPQQPKSKAKPKPKFDPLGKTKRKAGGARAKTTSVPAVQAPPELEHEDDPDGLMEKLAETFAGGLDGDNGELQSMVDTVMRQLLSKEVLYEPLREISAKYPEWLQRNEGKVSAEDRERYETQLRCIERLCAAYETPDSGFDEVLGLMQEIQQCGQPPEEIIKELAPDLQLGPDGLPLPSTGAQDALSMFGDLGKEGPGGCPMQ